VNHNEFGVRLKKLRAAKAKKLGRRKIPQREVAAQLNISPGAYGSWETGRTKPDVTLLPQIADYFEVSIDFLLGHTASVQTSLEPIATKTGLVWSLRRPAQTENEQKGIKIWERLTQGESVESIATALKVRSLREIERYLLDVIYTDMLSIDHLPQAPDLAERVRQAFGLREVIVVPLPVVEEALLGFGTILLGEAARAYFKAHAYEGMKVGIASGYSVSRLVYSLRRGECRSIEVYPLAISPVIETISLDANSLVGALAYRHYGYDVRGYGLQYTSMLRWEDAKGMRQFTPTQRILARAKSVDIAFMGLGVVSNNMVSRRRMPIVWLDDLLASRGLDLERMRQRGAIGDILYHLVDQNGQPVAPEISDLICSLDLQDLREMIRSGAQVVVIASRRRKVKIAWAAIKAGYANVFIIDDELARALLESEKRPT
jgi:DNA-binding transcriptional regulator LsrR (DeoR family)/DNA-binding XRE family transcriptional regulator